MFNFKSNPPIWSKEFSTIEELLDIMNSYAVWRDVPKKHILKLYQNATSASKALPMPPEEFVTPSHASSLQLLRDLLIVIDCLDLTQYISHLIKEEDPSEFYYLLSVRLYCIGSSKLKDLLNSTIKSDTEFKEELGLIELVFRSGIISNPFGVENYKCAILCCVNFGDKHGAVKYKNECIKQIQTLLITDNKELDYYQRSTKQLLQTNSELIIGELTEIIDCLDDSVIDFN